VKQKAWHLTLFRRSEVPRHAGVENAIALQELGMPNVQGLLCACGSGQVDQVELQQKSPIVWASMCALAQDVEGSDSGVRDV
jgi:hypothetical protein